MTGASIFCALHPPIVGISIGLFVLGMGAGLATVAWQNAVTRQVSKDERPVVSANLGGIMRFTAIVAPFVGSIILKRTSVEKVFITQMLFAGIAALLSPKVRLYTVLVKLETAKRMVQA